MSHPITITLDEPDHGMFGPDELWITLSGPDPMPDYPTIRLMVQERFDRHDVPITPMRYFPSCNGSDKPYEEIWIVKKMKEKVTA